MDIKDKIAKLLALAESPNENEAKAALLKARALMAQHKLEPEDVKNAEKQTVIKQDVDVTFTAMTNPWVSTLAGVIAKNYCCVSVRTHARGGKLNTIGFIGLEDDWTVCSRIFKYAYDCVRAYCQREIIPACGRNSKEIRERINAYDWGFVIGVDDMFKKQNEEHQEWGLVMQTPTAVMDATKAFGKPKQFGKVGGGYDSYKARGYQDGLAFDPEKRIESAARE